LLEPPLSDGLGAFPSGQGFPRCSRVLGYVGLDAADSGQRLFHGVHGLSLPLQVPAPKPAAPSVLISPYPGTVTSGPTARLLTPTLTSGDDAILDLLPDLRAALNGSGPALRLYGRDGRTAGPVVLEPVELGPEDDDPADPTAVAVTTSGSSGVPKTVLLSAAALLASAGATHDRLGGAGHWLLALPGQHVAGVQVLVRSLIAGTRPAVLDLSGGFTPEKFTEAAGRVGGRPGTRRYTALVPTQLIRLLTAEGGPGRAAVQALRGFDAVLIGGAAVGPVLREQASDAGVRLIGTYGMSETCGGCVYDGVPLDGVRVRLEDDGRVLLGGPMLARGYLGDPDGSAAGFWSDPSGQRWFRTDDAGEWDGDRLRILGRLDSVIITGGVNVAPGPVEAALQRLPGVAEAVVVGLPDPEWGQRVAAALVLSPGAAPPTLAQARAQVTAEVSAPAAPRQLTLLDALPLRGPGKPDRTAIETALAELPPLEGN
jgi:O-succinylbenzoic acid--CoA ligase